MATPVVKPLPFRIARVLFKFADGYQVHDEGCTAGSVTTTWTSWSGMRSKLTGAWSVGPPAFSHAARAALASERSPGAAAAPSYMNGVDEGEVRGPKRTPVMGSANTFDVVGAVARFGRESFRIDAGIVMLVRSVLSKHANTLG